MKLSISSLNHGSKLGKDSCIDFKMNKTIIMNGSTTLGLTEETTTRDRYSWFSAFESPVINPNIINNKKIKLMRYSLKPEIKIN